MDAHNLFEYAGCSTALARTKDPQTSKDAAKKMVESGALSEQEAQVFGWIKDYLEEHPVDKDFTARELAWWRYANKYYIIQRRLSGLRRKGKIERTGEKREGYCVWRLL